MMIIEHVPYPSHIEYGVSGEPTALANSEGSYIDGRLLAEIDG